ncbi:MAG: PAS domain-containing protein [Hyphomicrobiaceae bacterium]
MQSKDLEAFRNVPFLVWVKDDNWRYIWGNGAIDELAGERVVGKKDSELAWKAHAEALVKNDEEVLTSGRPHFMHERVDHSEHGKASLNVCKWVDEFNGQSRVFGISFIIPD